MANKGKNIAFWVVLLIMVGVGYDLFYNKINNNGYSSYAFSEFLNKVDEGQVSDVIIQGRNIEGHFVDGINFSTYAPDYPNLVDKLKSNGVKIEAVPIEGRISIIGILISWFPMLLSIFVWVFFMKQMQSGGGKAMGFGKSKAKLLTEKTGKIMFNDVAGIDEAKDELSEIVDFLKDPAKFQTLGGKVPKGCLLIGPPGTGKTLLARAIAGEANVPFFTISGSDFVEMFVGVGASRVRNMFEQGKENAPCIIFIDEIDAVGRHRGLGMGGGNDEREQTLNQLLVEMDGFQPNEGVILIAATNRPDVLDPALLRPGRFDRQIVVPIPDINGREKILKVHLKNIAVAPNVEARIIARGTPGFSGADLANLVNEAALLAARSNKSLVTITDLEAARDKVMMGAERRSMVMTEEDKTLTAYHEAGHALIAIFCPASDPIHKATIIPRGRSLGLVMRLPEADQHSITREKLEADIAVCLGGRAAEELIFGYNKVTSGASSDIKQATRLAKSMVTEWGMSDELGPILYQQDNQADNSSQSEATASKIDSEIRRIVEVGHQLAKKILTDNQDKLKQLANALLDYETLSGDEIKDILAGKSILKPEIEQSDLPKTSIPSSSQAINDATT